MSSSLIERLRAFAEFWDCYEQHQVAAEAASLIEELVEALEAAAQTFRRYEGLHAAKGTMDGCAKAAANALLAERYEAIIAKVRRGE